jgi:hypothetical protein
MLEQKQLNGTNASTWLTLSYRKWLWSSLLLLYFNLLNSCGTPPTPINTLQPQPQSTPVVHPFHATLQTLDSEFTITLDITPNHSGTNVFTVRVMNNHTAKPIIQAQIILYTTMQDMSMGTDSIILHADTNGQFSATNDNLNMGGHWAIGITIQTPDHIIHKAGANLVTPF